MSTAKLCLILSFGSLQSMPSKRTIIEIIVVLIFFIYATTTIEYETIPEPGVTDMGNGVLLYTL